MMLHTCTPDTQKAQAGGLNNQPGQHSDLP